MSESVSLNVNGMKCGGCETTVKDKLMVVDGVISVTADHKGKKVEVEFESEKVSLDSIRDVIAEAGFSVE
ncbi:MAG: heavy-metal-associated domain-containing protein [Methylococcales bacterium]|nr:heavy-metal-associated domain-containing protein [Methylococcales bacterium]